MFLAAHAAKVWILVRGAGLAETMSRYLIDRIEAAPNIEVLAETEIVELIGSEQDGLQRVRWRTKPGDDDTVRPVRHVFLFLGASPATEWLTDCGIDVDRTGFIRTGTDVEAPCPDRPPTAHETNVQGVFAVGDVRYCSVKRVGAAIGEGANVVAEVHGLLERLNAAD